MANESRIDFEATPGGEVRQENRFIEGSRLGTKFQILLARSAAITAFWCLFGVYFWRAPARLSGSSES